MNRPPGSVEERLVEVFRDQRRGLWAFFARGFPSAAEDLLQETFLRAWDHRAELEGGGEAPANEGIRRYLWRVARNLAIDQIRTRHRRGERAAPEDADARWPDRDPGADPALTAEMDEARRVVRETLDTLPSGRVRRCLELWLEEKDLSAISEEMGLGAGQVRGLLQRGRAELVRRAAGRFRPPGRDSRPAGGGSR